METRPRDPAHARVRAQQAAAAADRDITGRRRIAHELGKSERQVSRLVAKGALPATRATGLPNKPLAIRSADLDKVR